jgi:hypothetical protein
MESDTIIQWLARRGARRRSCGGSIQDLKQVAEKLHMLAALRQLGGRMSAIEKQRQQRVEDGENPAEVDRDAAQLALTDVVTFFWTIKSSQSRSSGY